MRVYLDNCCYNRPFDDQDQLKVRLETVTKLAVQLMMATGIVEYAWSKALDYEISSRRIAMTATETVSDNELAMTGMNVLRERFGPVDAERFVYLLVKDRFDYTEWQKNLFNGETVRSLGEKMMAFKSGPA